MGFFSLQCQGGTPYAHQLYPPPPPHALWSAEQKAAAQVYGKVIDLAFPAIDPATNEAVLDSLAAVYADHILHLNPDTVLCQGECTFVYRVVQRLEAAGIPTLAAGFRRYGSP